MIRFIWCICSFRRPQNFRLRVEAWWKASQKKSTLVNWNKTTYCKLVDYNILGTLQSFVVIKILKFFKMFGFGSLHPPFFHWKCQNLSRKKFLSKFWFGSDTSPPWPIWAMLKIKETTQLSGWLPLVDCDCVQFADWTTGAPTCQDWLEMSRITPGIKCPGLRQSSNVQDYPNHQISRITPVIKCPGLPKSSNVQDYPNHQMSRITPIIKCPVIHCSKYSWNRQIGHYQGGGMSFNWFI